MKTFRLFMVLLVISNTLSFGQNLSVKPYASQSVKADEVQNLDQYLIKNATSNTKISIWSDNFADTANWTIYKKNGTIGNWALISDTGAASEAWKFFWNSDNMNSPTANQGVAYFDGIYQFVNHISGEENSTITTSHSINLSAHSSVAIKFYQLYYSFNSDSTLLEISNDSIVWHSIMANADITANGNANQWRYGWKEFNISQWAANQPHVWIRFRFYASELAGTPPSSNFGGGYGWMIDDVSLFRPVNNLIQIDRVTLHDGYMQIPQGLGTPIYYDADITNLGAFTQTHVKLHGVELITNSQSASNEVTLTPGSNLLKWETEGYFFTPSSPIATYKVVAFVSSDSIPFLLAQDTFDIKVVCDTCKYSRDNNTYTSSRWGGTTGSLSNPYTVANRFMVNQDRIAYGINTVVNLTTKVYSKIKAVLYKYNSSTNTRVIVAQSANHYITTAEIPTVFPMLNPPSISLPFTTEYTMQKDSIYYAGIQVFGGTDTVKIATDNTGIPQYDQTSLLCMANESGMPAWYIWGVGNVPAMMIRTVFNMNEHWAAGIDDISKTQNTFSLMPNPAQNITRISYELENKTETTLIITDITGRTVQTIKQEIQPIGIYTMDVDLAGLKNGTYFCTLKTRVTQYTDKLIVIK
ncbi:MAG: T9SS type A sorting domain-containing protein [Bacteroidales bacterium]